jgi:hypothetical protein
MATYDHGVVSTETGAYGLYEDFESSDECEIITADDADGDAADYAAIARKMSGSFTLFLDTTKTLPLSGAVLTLTDKLIGTSAKVVCTRCSLKQNNKTFMKATVEFVRWPTNSIPA